jgi:hypothetical protein
MPFEPKKKTAALTGHCTVEEAEPVLAWLLANRQGRLDLSRCVHLHAAVLQVLMALRPAISKYPSAPALASVLTAALTTAPVSEQA